MENIKSRLCTILRILISLLLVFSISITLVYELDNYFYNDEVDYGERFKSLPENSLDYIVLGSSHAQYSFMPSMVYEKTGLYGFVLGSACQPLKVSYEMLKEAFKTQSPKLVILEVYTAIPLSEICKDDSCFVIAENQMTGEEKIETIDMLPDEKASQYYIDFLTYHNSWRYDGFFSTYKKPKSELNTVDYSSGYVQFEQFFDPSQNYWRPNYNPDGIYDVELEEEDVNALNNIKEYCDEKGVTLLLYKTPVDGMDDENYSYLNQVWKWADENGIQYVDFHKEAYNLDFYMVIHSSSFHAYVTGASIITNYLSNTINELDIDFKHIPYAKLNNIYNTNYEDMTIYYLYTETNPKQYLNHLANGKGIVLFRYIAGKQAISQEFIDKVNALGINNFSGNVNMYAIIKDGEVVSIDYGSGSASYDINGQTLTVSYDGIYNGETKHNKDEYNCNMVYFKSDLSNCVDKNIAFSYGIEWDEGTFMYHREW